MCIFFYTMDPRSDKSYILPDSEPPEIWYHSLRQADGRLNSTLPHSLMIRVVGNAHRNVVHTLQDAPCSLEGVAEALLSLLQSCEVITEHKEFICRDGQRFPFLDVSLSRDNVNEWLHHKMMDTLDSMNVVVLNIGRKNLPLSSSIGKSSVLIVIKFAGDIVATWTFTVMAKETAPGGAHCYTLSGGYGCSQDDTEDCSNADGFGAGAGAGTGAETAMCSQV